MKGDSPKEIDGIIGARSPKDGLERTSRWNTGPLGPLLAEQGQGSKNWTCQ